MPFPDQLRYAAERDAEPYREGRKLTDADLPNSVLAQLDAAWSKRSVLTTLVPISPEIAIVPAGIAAGERQAREQLAVTAMGQGRALLSCTVSWRQRNPYDGLDANPERGEPWEPGSPPNPESFVLVCFALGVVLPLVDLRPWDAAPAPGLYLLRCSVAGCAYQQHTTARVGVLRDHPRGAALIDGAAAEFLPHMLTDTNRCTGSGQMAQGFELSGRQR